MGMHARERANRNEELSAKMSNESAAMASFRDAADEVAREGDEPDRSPERIMQIIMQSLEDSKAEDIVTIPLEPGAALADAMIVASGRSNRHVSSIADHLLRKLKKSGVKGVSVEGLEHADWVLVDTGDIIVHIFRPEVRAFYNLEKLWSPHAPKQDA